MDHVLFLHLRLGSADGVVVVVVVVVVVCVEGARVAGGSVGESPRAGMSPASVVGRPCATIKRAVVISFVGLFITNN